MTIQIFLLFLLILFAAFAWAIKRILTIALAARIIKMSETAKDVAITAENQAERNIARLQMLNIASRTRISRNKFLHNKEMGEKLLADARFVASIAQGVGDYTEKQAALFVEMIADTVQPLIRAGKMNV